LFKISEEKLILQNSKENSFSVTPRRNSFNASLPRRKSFDVTLKETHLRYVTPKRDTFNLTPKRN